MSDITVGIYRSYDYPDLLRQTPGYLGRWGRVRFLVDEINKPCDLLVILNSLDKPMEVECGEVWQIIQEPPLDMFPWVFEGHTPFTERFSPLCRGHSGCRQSCGANPWHLEMSYDDLKKLLPPEKKQILSWITSNKVIFPGHKDRMVFLERLKASGIAFDLFGHGFASLPDKYQGLGSYRYSLAVENYSGPDYWTEKIADCFLAWTMPIYYGCTNLAEYFPTESFVQIDINDPEVFTQIRDVIDGDLYMERRDAIAEARRLVLDEYQLFPFIANRIGEKTFSRERRKLSPYRESLKSSVLRRIKRLYAP